MSKFKDTIDDKISEKKVFIIAKSTCPHCNATRKTFETIIKNGEKHLSKKDYEVLEIDKAPYSSDMDGIQNYLQRKTKGRTVPRIFIKGKFIGGNSDLQTLSGKGQLIPLLE